MLRTILFLTTILLIGVTCVTATNNPTTPGTANTELAIADSVYSPSDQADGFYFPDHTEEMVKASEVKKPEHYPCSCSHVFGGGDSVNCRDTQSCVCDSHIFYCKCTCFEASSPFDWPF